MKGSDLLRRPELRAPLLEALEGVEAARDPRRRLRAARERPARRGRARRPGARGPRPRARPRRRARAGRRQPRPRARRGLDRRPPAVRAAGLPRPRAGDGARGRRAVRRPPRRARRARARQRRLPRACGCATTSTRSTATTPTSTRRCRPSSGSRPARWRAGSSTCPTDEATADGYEAVLAPLYAWMHTLVQRSENGALTGGAGASARAWVALAGEGRRAHPWRAAALGAGYAGAVACINAIGLGPIDRDLSGQALRRGGLGGMREVLRRLGVDRALRPVRPLAPLRPVAARRPLRVDDAGRDAADEHRQLVLPAALPVRRAEPLALLAGHRDPGGGERPARADPPARRARARPAAPAARAAPA